MHSVNIVGVQMDTAFELYLPDYVIPSPEVQTNYKEIPYRNGSIDKTAPDGVVHYKDRQWKLIFKKTGEDVSAYDVPSLSQQINNSIHGRSGNIIFDDDPTWKWVGRVFVDDVSCEDNGMLIASVKLITDPFKYKLTNISKSSSLSSTAKNVSLTNGRKPIVPSVVVSNTATLSFTIKGVSYNLTLSSGTHKVAQLVLFEGTTVVSCSGRGTITFTYPEASL